MYALAPEAVWFYAWVKLFDFTPEWSSLSLWLYTGMELCNSTPELKCKPVLLCRDVWLAYSMPEKSCLTLRLSCICITIWVELAASAPELICLYLRLNSPGCLNSWWTCQTLRLSLSFCIFIWVELAASKSGEAVWLDAWDELSVSTPELDWLPLRLSGADWL